MKKIKLTAVEVQVIGAALLTYIEYRLSTKEKFQYIDRDTSANFQDHFIDIAEGIITKLTIEKEMK